MAVKDLGRGFGNLPSWLNSWMCPHCKKGSPIEDWSIVTVQLGPSSAEGRKCPQCPWIASQVGETDSMLAEDQEAIKKIKDRDSREKPDKEVKIK